MVRHDNQNSIGNKHSMSEKSIRKFFQDPYKILSPFIQENMTVVDLGCGPGYFSIDMAYMVGEQGKVIAVDSNKGVLEKLHSKTVETDIEDRITLHKRYPDTLGIEERVDFVLAFYAVNEVPDQKELFREIHSILEPAGKMLVVEPPFPLSGVAFDEMVHTAEGEGFIADNGPKVTMGKSVLFRNY